MNGCYSCATCGVLTSDWQQVGRAFYCDEHAAAARAARRAAK